jgi:hypothetical protein
MNEDLIGEDDACGEGDLLATEENVAVGEVGDDSWDISALYGRGGREVTLKAAGGLYSRTGVGTMRSS